MVLVTPEDLTQRQKAYKNMLDKIFVITLYAIPTITLFKLHVSYFH